MAVDSPLKGREMPNHQYLKREWHNGKWKYYYSNTENKETDSNADYKNRGPNASWVDAYKSRKNKKVSPLSSASEAASSKAAARGKSVASNYLDTSVMRARTTTVDSSDAAYNDSLNKLKTETADSKSRTDTYYNQKFQDEKNGYRTKLMSDLTKKYGNDIPDSEMTKINSKVEEYSRSLWNDVYKPMADRVNKAQQQNADRITRYLKKLYNK